MPDFNTSYASDRRPTAGPLAGRAKALKLIMFWLAFTVALGSTSRAAATWLDTVYLTFNTPVQSNAAVVTRQQVLKTQYGLPPQIISLPLPANVAIGAVTFVGGKVFYVPDVPFSSGGITASPRDVIQFDGQTSTIYLSAKTMGLPPAVAIDTITVAGSDVLFSVNAAAAIAGVVVGPADVLRWNGSAVSVVYSAQNLGIAKGSKLTGLEYLPNGHLLMSFDVAGTIGVTQYRAGEILEFSPSDNVWARVRRTQDFDVPCNPCRARDIAAVANLDVVFRNGFDLYEH